MFLQYCVESQIRQRGYDPETSMVIVKPRPVSTDTYTLLAGAVQIAAIYYSNSLIKN